MNKLALNIIMACTAILASPAQAESFYIFIDGSHSNSIGKEGFAGATSGAEIIPPALRQSGIGVNGGLGLVLSRNLSVEAGYYELPAIREITPGGLRDVPVDANPVNATALSITPYGYRIRLRYFKPLTHKLDFTVSTGWQQVNYKIKAADNLDSAKESAYSLVHSVGFSYALSPKIVMRTEYHYHQRFIDRPAIGRSNMTNIGVGFEFFF